MADEAKWARRVSEWKASGLTSAAYSRGREFTAGGLRHWAYRLRRTGKPRVRVRMARVVRLSGAKAALPEPPAGAGALVVEVGAVRIAVRAGFDRATLAAVLETVTSVGSAR